MRVAHIDQASVYATRAHFLAGALALTVSACDGPGNGSAQLASCLASTEQTILLRQLNATSAKKENVELCIKVWSDEGVCRALYLDANGVVRQCMNEAGYIFLNQDFYLSRGQNPYEEGDPWKGGKIKDGVCAWQEYRDPRCYHLAWWFKLTHWWAFQQGQQ